MHINSTLLRTDGTPRLMTRLMTKELSVAPPVRKHLNMFFPNLFVLWETLVYSSNCSEEMYDEIVGGKMVMGGAILCMPKNEATSYTSRPRTTISFFWLLQHQAILAIGSVFCFNIYNSRCSINFNIFNICFDYGVFNVIFTWYISK